jgi:hypothetical protein
MTNVYPNGIPSAQLMGVIFIPFVYGIPSAEVFGTPNIPKFAGITSAEAFGSPTVGIWWLHWRAFNQRNMFVRQIKSFSTIAERYQYAENLMSETYIRYMWKFGPMKFGRPILPKAKVWNHRDIWIREGLR